MNKLQKVTKEEAISHTEPWLKNCWRETDSITLLAAGAKGDNSQIHLSTSYRILFYKCKID